MKKVFGVIVVLFAVFFVFSCASDKPATAAQGGVPTWVDELRLNAPEGTIVGAAPAKMATASQSMTVSETRARAQIARALDSTVQDSVKDFFAGSEVDPKAVLAFSQNITTTLSNARLQGARIARQNLDAASGQWWTVIYFNQADAEREIFSAVDSAKRLAIPAIAAYNAEAEMQEKIKQAAKETWYGDIE